MNLLPPTPSWSLHTRIFVIAGVACLAILIAGGVAMARALAYEDQATLDQRLVGLAHAVLAFSKHEIDEPARDRELDLDASGAPPGHGSLYRYQVWSSGGELLLAGANSVPGQRLSDDTTEGFSNNTWGGEQLRVYTLPSSDGRMRVQVAESLDERASGAALFGARFALYLGLPFVLICGVAAWMLQHSLAAVHASAAALAARSPLDLAPIRPPDPPRELLPMFSAVNALLARVERSLGAERDFCSTAAHELRGPLAGMRAQAQVAAGATDDAERRQALHAIMVSVDRAAHLLDQLLDLARGGSLAGGDRQGVGPVRMADVLDRLRDDIRPQSARRRVRVNARLDEPVIQAWEPGLALLLRNLLVNAIHHSPPDATVEVLTQARAGSVVLIVDDAGPGIAPEDRARAFQRFNRLGRRDAEGVGLGLSIVAAVAEQHSAQVRLLDSPLGGLRVEVEFRRG